MLKLEERVEVKVLKEQGYSIRQIAKKLGISRNTVRKALKQDSPVEYKRQEVSSKIEPYKGYIQAKIEGEPMYTASRLFREIKGFGYIGSCSLVRLYVGQIRVKKEKSATVRFKTLPGQQGQVDFDFYKRIKFSDYEERKVSLFNMVLGYSRMMHYEYCFRHDLESFIDAHIRAFEYLGGVLHEILYDNVKCVVIERYEDNGVRWNSQFLDFASYYRFKPILCKPYRAQTKGKVKRPHQYVERDFFIGQEFKNLGDLNNRCREWLNEVANKRIHGTTNEIPKIRLEQEKGYLLALVAKRYEYYQEISCKSSKDCYICYEGNRYSVPHKYANKKGLLVKVSHSQEKIYIYEGKELICSHNLCSGKGQMITNPEYIKGLVPRQNNTELQRIYGEFSYLGETYRRYLAGLKRNKVEHSCWQVKKILELVYSYGQDEVNAAIERALEYEAYGYSYIRNICQERVKSRKGGDFVSIKEILVDMLKQYGLPEVEVRSLTIYFENNKERMRYNEYKKKGYFIGSGVVEGACKHIVGSWLKQSGMKWSIKGAQAILQLRLCCLNNRWNNYWSQKLKAS